MLSLALLAVLTSDLPQIQWRPIGPFRGGRTVGAVGVPSRKGTFYMGVNNGGVWKTDDYGRVWRPLFDKEDTGSVGAVAVAESDPEVVYAGSGEGLHRPDLSTGDGLYRSADGGKTWTHLGLRDAQQIGAIAVDPKDPNRIFVAALGHPYGPNTERGVYRSNDGGKTLERVLYRDAKTGAIDVVFEPGNSQVIYAVLWEAREAPWENGSFTGPGSGLQKSTDGGTTWKSIGAGLPTRSEGIGRIGFATCPSDPKRLYALADGKEGGLFRSDDGGENFHRVNGDDRLYGRGGDFKEVRVDPKNADTVLVANVVTWKSLDGGKTFSALRGAPGGDDYHRLWIDPDDPRIILLAGDQGAVVTVNGGETWSSWYNQPTSQFYHVAADNGFPYRVCGGQQESGSACVSSRGEFGSITFRDWRPAGFDEYGYAAPDPLDPDIVYGGRVTRFDRRTGQVQDVSPRPLKDDGYRVLRTAPLVFSPIDPTVLFFASERLWRTADGGRTWVEMSPDLTRAQWAAPKSVLDYEAAVHPTRRGVIYALAPSPLDRKRLWAGTDDGLIHVTADFGATWSDVTPPGLVAWSKVSILEASHSDPLEAYAAVNTLRLDDLHPHVYRTRDGGKTWVEIVQGIRDGTIVNVVREDPKRRGLLFAGTEQEVYFSVDDGDHWRSLRMNMPSSSIRDLAVKDDDLIAATHGRGFFILDGITPLRQLQEALSGAAPFLFRPGLAFRARFNTNTDTPLPPDEPAGENGPDGALLDYYLPKEAPAPLKLEILDGAGHLVRGFSSEDVPPPPPLHRNIPDYWIRPVPTLARGAGFHRFSWDLHGPVPNLPDLEYPIAAVYHDTPLEPRGVWALPGEYVVKLTVGDKTVTQPLTIRMDPRVKATAADLDSQYASSHEAFEDIGRARTALDSLASLLAALPREADYAPLEEKAKALQGRSGESGARAEGLRGTLQGLQQIYEILQGADAAPTTQASAALAKLDQGLARQLKDLADLQAEVSKRKGPPVPLQGKSKAP